MKKKVKDWGTIAYKARCVNKAQKLRKLGFDQDF